MARKYQIKFPDNLKPDDDFVQWADDLFTELQLAPEVAQRIAGKWGEYSNRRLAQLETDYQKGLDALKAQHGATFDADVAAGRGAVKALGLSAAEVDALDMATGKPFGAVSILARIGKNISGGGTADPGAGKVTTMSAEIARAEIAMLQADTKFQESLRDMKNSAARQQALERWEHLHSLAHPPVIASEPSAAPAKPAAGGTRQEALDKIATLQGNKTFVDALFNPNHAEHVANKAAWSVAGGGIRARARWWWAAVSIASYIRATTLHGDPHLRSAPRKPPTVEAPAPAPVQPKPPRKPQRTSHKASAAATARAKRKGKLT